MWLKGAACLLHCKPRACTLKAGPEHTPRRAPRLPAAVRAGAFASAILAARPKGVKGGTISGYLLSASLCSSMGPGIPVTVASVVHAAQGSRKAEA